MDDRQVSATCVLAVGLWGACLALWLVSWLTASDALGDLSIIVMGAGATATVRVYFVDLGRRIRATAGLAEKIKPVRTLR